jgi:hypothetical protein
MSNLLIDFNKIVKPNNMRNLENRIIPIPETSFSIGLILVISKKQYNILNKLPKGDIRVKYINSTDFVNSISDYSYIIYDKKKKVCEIIGAKSFMIPKVLETTLLNIPNDVTLCVGIDLDNTKLIQEYIDSGFHAPYISNRSPMGVNFFKNGLCLIRENNIVNDKSANEVKYVLKQNVEKKDVCTLKVQLSDWSIKYLRNISMMGSTINRNGIITQKEVAGRFVIKKVTDDLVHYLDVDKQSIIHGEEEGVKVAKGLYNFHSHPVEAYERNNVKFAWPSAQDYLGFLSASQEYDTILHIVASIEGFYIISLHSDWIRNKEKINKKMIDFILTTYSKVYTPKVYTPEVYIKHINSIHYAEYSVFFVQYFNWHNANTSFTVSYHKTGTNCFSNHSTLESSRSFIKT